MKTKVLFYCTKGTPKTQLVKYKNKCELCHRSKYENDAKNSRLNGKIVCECEVELDKLETEFYIEEPLYKEYGTYQALKRICLEQLDIVDYDEDWCDRDTLYCNEDYLNEEDEKNNKFLKESCLSGKELQKYFNRVDIGYALHISNLKVFDEPLELNEINVDKKCKKCVEECVFNKEIVLSERLTLRPAYCYHSLKKAPQNMQWCYFHGVRYCLISIRPEWLCKILNGEKTIEVRKKILKGMM